MCISYLHMYIYIYVCVCVRVCIHTRYRILVQGLLAKHQSTFQVSKLEVPTYGPLNQYNQWDG